MWMQYLVSKCTENKLLKSGRYVPQLMLLIFEFPSSVIQWYDSGPRIAYYSHIYSQ